MLIFFFRLLSHLPLAVLQRMGSLMGWTVYFASSAFRQRLRTNLSIAGYANHLNEAVSAVGKSIGELPFVWYGAPERVMSTATIEHWAVVQAAIDGGKGIIFLTPHLGCFEIIAQAIAVRIPLTALYRPPRKKLLQPLLEQARKRPNLGLAPTNLGGIRKLMRSLKQGGAIGLLPDQVPQNGEGVWARFFGKPAYTMTLPARLHESSGAPIILAYAERLEKGRGFVIHFSLGPTLTRASAEENATLINQSMEALISRCPSQYFWSYNRFKTPKGVAAPSMSIATGSA